MAYVINKRILSHSSVAGGAFERDDALSMTCTALRLNVAMRSQRCVTFAMIRFQFVPSSVWRKTFNIEVVYDNKEPIKSGVLTAAEPRCAL